MISADEARKMYVDPVTTALQIIEEQILKVATRTRSVTIKHRICLKNLQEVERILRENKYIVSHEVDDEDDDPATVLISVVFYIRISWG